jgi:hypothetical protein
MLDVTVTNRQLRVMYDALQVLGTKRMASQLADVRVGRLLQIVKPLAEPIGTTQRKHAQEEMDAAPPEQTEHKRQLMLMRIADKQRETDEAPAPPFTVFGGSILHQEDLPKEMSGLDGWKNAAGLGALLADLGPLFHWPTEEEAAKP